jgi:CheY-like chemotaxis protein
MRQRPPDLVLLDVMMPDIDGGEVAYRMKRDPALSEIPVVFLTTLVSENEGEHGRVRHGDFCFVGKPSTPSRLMAVIEEELAQHRTPTPAVPTAAPVNATVLIADDDKDLRSVLASFLNLQGYRVLQAEDGITALQMIATGRDGNVDVVVTDYTMPRMNGVELLEHLQGLSPETRVVFISGHNAPPELEKWRQTGTRFLTKPLVMSNLVRAIADALATQVKECSRVAGG